MTSHDPSIQGQSFQGYRRRIKRDPDTKTTRKASNNSKLPITKYFKHDTGVEFEGHNPVWLDKSMD